MNYVEVLNENDSPVNFEGRKNNVFNSINEAIRNILIYSNPKLYQIKLFGDFDEYVILPEHFQLKFIVDPDVKSSIRAVNDLNVFNFFDRDIRIDHIIEGTLHPASGNFNYIKLGKPYSDIYKKIKAESPEIINAIIANNFFNRVKDMGSCINRMLLLLENKTMNLQILLLTRALKEDIHFLSMKMKKLALVNNYNRYWEYRLQETREFQELLEKFITQPKQKVQKINRYIDNENLLKTTEFDDMPSIVKTNTKKYRKFIYNILFKIQELLTAYNYMLDKFILYLRDEAEDYLLQFLLPLQKQFKDISTGFDALSRYIHGLGDNNHLIINGINSSITLLKLAENNISGIHGMEFKDTIIEFLNKYNKPPIKKLELDSSNQEVINALREFTKNCPDADYRLIRYMNDHPQGFTVVSTFASVLGVVYTIAGLTGMAYNLYKTK